MVTGHDTVVAELMSELPRVSLFVGPKSVGKFTTAEYLRTFYKIRTTDWLYVKHLSADSAADIVSFARIAPVGDRKLIVVDLDTATRIQQDSLLLTLEDTPATVHFILITTKTPAPTILSRTRRFVFPLLSQEDMEEVLREVLSDAANVERLARVSGGQVYRAFIASKQAEQRADVLVALNAFETRDKSSLEKVAGTWSPEHTSLLETWCQEMITQRWRIFDPTDSGIKDRKLAIRILLALRAGVRPRFVVRSKLMDIWKDYTA